MSTTHENAMGGAPRPWLGRRQAALAAFATALLFALAQPPSGVWPLAFLCLVPLLGALAGRGLLGRATLGALAGGLAALAVAIGPAATGTARFFGLPFWQGWLIGAGIGQGFGIAGFTAFAVLAGDPRRGSVAQAALRAGLAFAAAEWIRATLFGGLPWLLLAYALAPQPALLALAPWGGVPLLSAWLGAIAVAALRLGVGPARGAAIRALALFAALGFGAALAAPALDVASAPGAPLPAGAVRPLTAAARAPGSVRIGLVQPALPMEQWADPLHAASTVAALTRLSVAAAETRGFELLIWPENAVQALLPANEGLVVQALMALDGNVPHLLLGAPRYDPATPTRRFNAALLYRATGTERADLIATHDKGKLLPLFESTPRWRWLAAIVPPGAGLTPGDDPAVLRVSEALGVGPLICYEVLFPGVARQHVRDGAGVLVNLSNDAWFGGSGGAEQHFAASIVLAATHRRPLLRSTPTGVTAAIDAGGRVALRLPQNEPGVLAVEVAPGTSHPPAVWLGDAPAWLALVFASAWTVLDRVRKLRDRPREG